MPKRSNRKTGATRNSEQKSSGWSWMIMGLLVGLFVAFLVYLDKIPEQGNNVTASKKEQKTSKPETKEKKVRPKEHEFDFYTVLPDRKVEVTVDEGEPVKSKPKAQVKTQDNSPGTQSAALYQLQVGAFKSLEKADAMKARLAFMGVESNIQVMQASGQKMYRVRVGPNSDAKKMEQIKAQLKSQNINTFMQKL